MGRKEAKDHKQRFSAPRQLLPGGYCQASNMPVLYDIVHCLSGRKHESQMWYSTAIVIMEVRVLG